MIHALLVATCIFIATFAFAPSAPCAQKSARAIFIVDASASMSQPLATVTKLEAVRGAIATIESIWDPTSEVGLMAYGHRRRVDCQDIEVLVPPGQLAAGAASLSKALKNIQPQGLTPATEAVRRAAAALDYTNHPAVIVLICDGIDTCGGNPREAAVELLRKAVDLKVHLVALDMRPDEIEALKPLADETRGRIYPAATPEELAAALREIALDPFGSEPVRMTEAAQETSTVGGPTGVLELRTFSDVGGWPVSAVYFIRKKDAPGSETVKTGAGPRFYLEPGRYLVEAKWGPATAQTEVEVSPGTTTRHTLVMAAGKLNLTAKLSEDGEPVRALFHIYQVPEREGDRGNLLTTSRTGNLQLPAGEYLIEAEWGGVPAESTRVEVIPDENVEKTILIKAGVLKIEARMALDGEIVRPYYVIWPRSKPNESLSKPVASGAMNPAGFRLPAGQYTVTAEWGDATASIDVEVRAAETTEAKLNMNAGIVELRTASPRSPGERITFSIEKPTVNGTDRAREVIARGSQREFRLTAGEYVVVATSRKAEGELTIEVKAGERHQFSVPME